MNPHEEEYKIQEKIKKLLENPPQHKLSDGKRRELIARIYKINDEKKSLVEFLPFKDIPTSAKVLVSLLFIFGVIYLFLPSYPVIGDAKGTVEIYRRAQSEWVKLKGRKLRLYKNDVLRVPEGGAADIVLADAYHLRARGDTEVKLSRPQPRVLPGSTRFRLLKGKVFAYYKNKGLTSKAFYIETPKANVSVVGTGFAVEAEPGSLKTWVGVLSGVVRVTGKSMDASVLVEGGEKAIVGDSGKPEAPERLRKDELLEMAELYRIGEKPQVALLISTGKARVRELLSLTPLYISTGKEGILPEKIEEIAEMFNKAVKEESKEKHEACIKGFEKIIETHPNPKYDVQLLLFIAAYYGYIDEHEKAVKTFEKVLKNYPKSTLASIARCAIGIIYEEKLNDVEKARAAFEKVLSDYPESAEIHEAKSALTRLSHGDVSP